MNIQIKHPCTESWTGMTPDASGRFCALCSKTVHDFTGKPKEELLAFLLCSSGSPCVRMLASQESFTPEEVQTVAATLVRSGKPLSVAALALVSLFATGCQTESPGNASPSVSISSGMVTTAPLPIDSIQRTDTVSPPTILGKPVPSKPASKPIVADPEPQILGEIVMMGAPPDVTPPPEPISKLRQPDSAIVPATK